MRSYTKIGTTFIWLLFFGCDSTLASGGGGFAETDEDLEDTSIINAVDDRVFPTTCTTAKECNDDDPCTVDECVKNGCVFTHKEIDLVDAVIPTSARAFDVALAPGVAYVAVGLAGVEVFDISNPGAPSLIATIATQAGAWALDADNRGVVVAEGGAGFEVFAAGSFNRLSGMIPLTEKIIMEEVVEIGMGPRYVIVSGYRDGVAMMDFGNLSNPQVVNQILDTPGRAVNAVSPNNSFALVADSLGGASTLMFDGGILSPPIHSIGRVTDADVRGQTGILAEYGAGLSVLDLSDPALPEKLSLTAGVAPGISCALLGQQTAVVVERYGRLVVFDLLDPFRPSILTTWDAGGRAYGLDAKDNLIAVAIGDSGLAVLQTGCGL